MTATNPIGAHDVAQCCVCSSCYTSAATFGIAALVTLVALLIILDNHLKLTVWNKVCDNLTVLKPGTVDVLWSVAKWSGVASVTALGVLGLTGLGTCFLINH